MWGNSTPSKLLLVEMNKNCKIWSFALFKQIRNQKTDKLNLKFRMNYIILHFEKISDIDFKK